MIQEVEPGEEGRPAESNGQVEQQPESEVTIEYTYRFSEWEGPEDVIPLCRKHLDELASVIEDGISRGYLTRDE